MSGARCSAAVVLLGLTGLMLGAAAPPKSPAKQALPVPELPALLRRVAEQEPEDPSYAPWGKLGLADARELILDRKIPPESRGGPVPAGGLQGAEQRVARAYGLPPEAARALVAARLLLEPPGGWFMELPQAQAERALQAHREALRAAPGNLAVLASLAAASKLMALPGYEATLLEGISASTQPVEVALKLARARLPYWNCELAALAVSREPQVLPRALEALGLGSKEATSTVLYLAAYRSLTKPGPSVPSPALSERLLRNLLAHGLPELALDVLASLPPQTREALRSGHFSAVRAHYESGVQSDAESADAEDLRLDVAMALLAVGRREEARAWHEAIEAHPAPAPSAQRDVDPREEGKAPLLAWLLGPAGADPFELLLLGGNGVVELSLLSQGLASRYPERARSGLDNLVSYLRQQDDPFALRFSGQLSFLQGAQQELAAARTRELARLETMLRALPAATAAAAAQQDPQSARIAAQLATPALQVFTETALPRTPKGHTPRWRAVGERELKLPKGFWPVRIERSGTRVVAAALSHRLDPAGEVSGGAYWLLLSKDGGVHWETPLYTGLRHLRPYELDKTSSVPMLEKGRVRLATSVRELDEKSIHFPPVDLRPKREQQGRLLEAPLAALTRDRDGDGLTDLVEDRLLLDPAVADTDGDGVPDGSDALPQVVSSPDGATQDAQTQLVSALLFELSGGAKQPQGLVTGLPADASDAGLQLPQGPAPTSLDDLRFLNLDRARLRGLRTLLPTVALSDAELVRAQERFGRFFPMSIEVYLNAAGDQALLVFDEGWRGGSFLAHLENGRWTLTPRGSWIT